MKKITTWIIVVLALMFAGNAHADFFAESTLKNDGFAGKFEYFVDVYLVSTGDEDFELGRAFLTFSYNTDVLSDPVLSLEQPDFHDNALYNPMALVDDSVSGRVQLQVTASGASGTILPASEIRLGRITFTIDQAAYKTETAGIDWVDALADTFVEDETGTGIFLLLTPVDLEGNTSLVCLPEISGTPDGTAEVGFSYSFTPTIVQTCSPDPITFSISNPPSWASFNDDTGELYGAPDFTDVGTYSGIVITATDAYSDSTSLTAFTVEVTDNPSPGGGGGGGGSGGGCFISALW